MKGPFSRFSHVPAKGYSGLFQLQGGMIADADLNENTQIARQRSEALGNDTIRDGVPEVDGLVGIVREGTPDKHADHAFLRPGIVYADGLRGEVTSGDDVKFGIDNPLDLLRAQADFPGAPALPDQGKFVLFADVWHREVHPLEDPRIAEIAFHGAWTSYRSKTMAQLKWAPLDNAEDIAAGSGDYPQIGSGRLTLSKLNDADTGNTCDPCASEIPLDSRVANSLFRLEVIDVTGTPGTPKTVTLAWSVENASEIAPLDQIPEGFEEGSYAFEHFSRETESHKGALHDLAMRKKSVIEASVNPNASEGFVRRWDGACDFEIGVKAGETIGSGLGGMDNNMPSITLETFKLRIDFEKATVLPGDYWLIELRSNAFHDDDTDERYHVVSETPVGIKHHYALLFRVTDSKPHPLSDAEHRRLSFPVLSNLPATHVGFENRCDHIFDDAENVQEALDELCKLDAGKIKLKEGICPDLYGNAKTVEEALAHLCGVDFCKNVDRSWMRFFFDWGVICGLRVRVKAGDLKTVFVTPGMILDRGGQIGRSSWQKETAFSLDEIEIDPDVRQTKGPVCLAAWAKDGKIDQLVILPHSKTALGDDLSFTETIEACEDQRKITAFDTVFERLGKEDQTLLQHVVGISVTGSWSSGKVRYSKTQFDATTNILDDLASVYAEQAGADEADKLKRDFAFVEAEYPTDGLIGSSLELQHTNQLAGKLNVFVQVSQEFIQACKCRAIWPECPDPADDREFVPLAELAWDPDSAGNFLIYNACMLECRKQAMTPRTLAYYLREQIHAMIVRIMTSDPKPQPGLASLEKLCCPPPRLRDADQGSDNDTDTTLKDRPWVIPEEDIVVGTIVQDIDRKYFSVQDRSLEAATEILTGNGIAITDVIDLTAADSFDRIAKITGTDSIDERLTFKEKIAPGDEVAVLMNEGRVDGYLVVRRNAGKYPFEPGVTIDGSGTGDGRGNVAGGPDVDAIAERLKELSASSEKLNEGITAAAERTREAEQSITEFQASQEILIASTREASASLEAQVGLARNESQALAANLNTLTQSLENRQQDAASVQGNLNLLSSSLKGLGQDIAARQEDISGVQQQISALSTGIGTLRQELSSRRSELSDIMTEQAGVVSRMAGRMPVMMLGSIDPDIIDNLAELDILTVGQFVDIDKDVLREISGSNRYEKMARLRERARRLMEAR